MLKIYSDRSVLRPGLRHVAMLYPFWGKPPEDPRNPATGRFERWMQAGQSVLTMTSLAEADVAVLPTGWEDLRTATDGLQLAENFLQQAKRAGVPTAVFFWSDSADEVPLDTSLIFRTSLYRSKKKSTEFAMPAWSEDIVDTHLHGRLPLRTKQTTATIGFCGWAGPAGRLGPAGPLRASAMRRVKHAVNRIASMVGARKLDTTRDRALRILSQSTLVQTNFILRDRYLGGPTILQETGDPEIIGRIRNEFVQNMVESDYVLCVRGTGNYSYRLYEALSCGRIPVFVDTDCVLPFDFARDWKRYCVWIDETDLPRIAERVADFHASLSASDFMDLQKECRAFWEDYLSPVGFFENFYRHLQTDAGAAVPITRQAVQID